MSPEAMFPIFMYVCFVCIKYEDSTVEEGDDPHLALDQRQRLGVVLQFAKTVHG